jgi:hypothetical protein
VVLEVGFWMTERDMPETEEYVARLWRKAEETLRHQPGARARFLWSITRMLLLPGHERREAAALYARELSLAIDSLPADHWLRGEAERIQVALGH